MISEHGEPGNFDLLDISNSTHYLKAGVWFGDVHIADVSGGKCCLIDNRQKLFTVAQVEERGKLLKRLSKKHRQFHRRLAEKTVDEPTPNEG